MTKKHPPFELARRRYNDPGTPAVRVAKSRLPKVKNASQLNAELRARGAKK